LHIKAVFGMDDSTDIRLPASARDRKWLRGGHVTVLGRASLCSLALIAAGGERIIADGGQRERNLRSAVFELAWVLSLEIGVALIGGRDGDGEEAARLT
jgi:hypothetical protein